MFIFKNIWFRIIDSAPHLISCWAVPAFEKGLYY